LLSSSEILEQPQMEKVFSQPHLGAFSAAPKTGLSGGSTAKHGLQPCAAADGHHKWPGHLRCPRLSRSKSATPLGTICDPLRSCGVGQAATDYIRAPHRASLSPFPQQLQARAAYSQAASFFSGNPYPAQTPTNAQGLPSDGTATPHRHNLEFFA
jgi:hypothetical protein